MTFQTLFSYCPKCGSRHFVFNNEKSKCCADCGFVYYLNPSAAVAAFIMNDKGELLVCTRAKEPAKGTFDLPGGFCDFDETAEQALHREINEELGVNIISEKYLFSLPNKYEYCGLTVPTIDLFYLCQIDTPDKIKPSDDVAYAEFMPFDAINSEKFGLISVKNAMEKFTIDN
ncbi:MAG: NUDIX domain-containing protein [Paludibacter sp.]|jgi:ADP-ribose pyrophosphatase YjhB (NUDIX family)|nr:NUDIX domain-containing protein [Paludibacter sp.]